MAKRDFPARRTNNPKPHNNIPVSKPVEEMSAKEVVEEVGKPLAEGLNEGFKENIKVPVEKEPDLIMATVANCKKVRARKNPTTAEDNVIAELGAGTKVEVLDSSNPEWTRVKIGNNKAWIMSDYLKIV